MSLNRKYTQLTVEDVMWLQQLFIESRDGKTCRNGLQELRVACALDELADKARNAHPGSSICLAYAVKRGVK